MQCCILLVDKENNPKQPTEKGKGGGKMHEFNLKTYISNICDNGTYTREYLSQYAGYKKPAGFSKWLNNEDSEIADFNDLIRLLDKIDSDRTCEFLAKYSMSVSPTHATAKSLLEYLSSNRELDYMKALIERMESSKSASGKDWARAYALQHEWQKNYYTIDVNKHLKEIAKLKTSDKYLELFVNVMKCNCYYHNEDNKMAYEIANELLSELKDIEDGYIKNAYSAKVNEVLSFISLWVKNKPEEARENAEAVIKANIGEAKDAFAYSVIGHSYYYTSYEKAVKYISKSKELYVKLGEDFKGAVIDADETLEKIKIFWMKKDVSEGFKCIENELLFKAINGENISQLLGESKEKINCGATYNLIKGYSEKGNDTLLQSMVQFLKKGDTFSAYVPMLELKKRGYNEVLLNEWINFHS